MQLICPIACGNVFESQDVDFCRMLPNCWADYDLSTYTPTFWSYNSKFGVTTVSCPLISLVVSMGSMGSLIVFRNWWGQFGVNLSIHDMIVGMQKPGLLIGEDTFQCNVSTSGSFHWTIICQKFIDALAIHNTVLNNKTHFVFTTKWHGKTQSIVLLASQLLLNLQNVFKMWNNLVINVLKVRSNFPTFSRLSIWILNTLYGSVGGRCWQWDSNSQNCPMWCC